MLTDDVQELTRREYELFRDLIYQQSGINLGEQKMQLVRARLGKRLRSGGFRSYREYYEFVRSDTTGRELTHLIDAISTNTTHLFREQRHFDFLATMVKSWAVSESASRRMPIRIWSAGCSSGEEPYSIAMTMADLAGRCPSLQFKILATDISTQMLDRAVRGTYPPDRLASVPPEFKRRFFDRVKEDGETAMRVRPGIQGLIHFARFNLMSEQYPFRNGFDFIFCRNVMIYFDRPTQEKLVASFTRVLRAGGYLLIGHSESLNNTSHALRYVMPTVYEKP
jgi:chemotaxis protein methyltransferase CheR